MVCGAEKFIWYKYNKGKNLSNCLESLTSNQIKCLLWKMNVWSLLEKKDYMKHQKQKYWIDAYHLFFHGINMKYAVSWKCSLSHLKKTIIRPSHIQRREANDKYIQTFSFVGLANQFLVMLNTKHISGDTLIIV